MSGIFLTYSYDWSVIPKSIAFFERGLGVTVRIAILSVLFSLVLGLVVALVRMAPGPIGLIGFFYVQVFRALSLYVYILFVYFGIAAAFKLDFDPITAGVLSLTLLNSAYMAEIYRSAIQAIEPGQREAARSLGLGTIGTFVNVTFPQAWRIAVPSLVNQFTDIIKDSSVVALIGAPDLMYITTERVSFYQRPFEFYTTVAGIYFVMVVIVAQLAWRLEKRLRRHLA
ncbi:MAG: amino acid ABC transporter permease [Chloroflexi bacterium]|nr:MAG: amino acid ABC transporter permease [Chloroflexota bacterium]TMG65639.1 MAG: amino acid ABC transporter permease [Chloroflexota bacterium]